MHIYLCITSLLVSYSKNLYFMIIEHLTSNLNAYVNFILYGSSEILTKFIVYKEFSCPCKKKNDFDNLIGQKL